MNATLAPSPANLRAQLVAALGADSVRDDAATLEFMGTDVYHAGGRPALVVRPKTVEALQSAVRACAAAGVAMVPRSGGASYTDGYLYAPGGHVLFDCGALDQIEVDVPNAVVTVGPGVSWAALRTRLMEVGLRTPFWGPFSGLVATVGGSVSQNAISHGSGAYGSSAPSVLGMDVVLANKKPVAGSWASYEHLLLTATTTGRRHSPDGLSFVRLHRKLVAHRPAGRP